MTAVAPPAGAVSRNAVAWHAIQWPQAPSMVRRLHARLVPATQAGRWGKVRALQRLLTHSFSAKRLAVKRVTANQGTRTPGVAGVRWETPEHTAQAVTTLGQHGDRTRPLRRVSIPQSTGTGTRPRAIPCRQDRAMPALYLLALAPLAETLAEPNASGFRLARSTADAIDQCHRVVSLSASAQWSFEGDIRACVDSLSHDWWGAHLPLATALLRQGRPAGVMDTHLLSPPDTGGPQGGVSAPVSMTLALNGLERHIKQAVPACQGHTRTTVHVIRCADACISTGSAQDFLEQEVQPLVAQLLAERDLARSREKTRGTPIAEGFDWLGTRGRKYRGQLLCTPAKKNVRSFLDTLRGIVKRHQQALTGNLIMQLHPVMRGWAPSHQPGASKRTGAQGDHQIFTLLWQWARRRHPRTSRHGMRDKDLRAEAGHHWVVFGHVTRPKGTQQDVRLFRASRVPMRRHTTIKGEANPYDPPWAPYFEARLGVRMAHNLRGRRHLMRLWQEQDGRCAVWQQRITQ
jgi:RNA-directed DNA polymerase